MVPLSITPSVGDGVTTVFTLGATPVNLTLYQDRLFQIPGTDYTVSGVSATFAVPPVLGALMNAFVDATIPALAPPPASIVAAAPGSSSTTELIASLRQRTFTAGAPRDFPDSDCLRALNENISTYLLRLICKRNTNYLVETIDIPIGGGVASYQVPAVAICGALRAVTMIVAGIPHPLIEKDLPSAVASNYAPGSTQFPTGYYFMGPNIVLWPSGSVSGLLRIHYHRRPSTLVMENQCIQITGFPGGAALGNYRASFSTLPPGFVGNALVDVVSNIENFYRWQTSQAIQGITANTVDIPGPQPATLQAGDWICLYNTAPVITDCPTEVLNAVVQAAACDMFMAKGSTDSYQRAMQALKEEEEDCGPLIQQRNTGAMRKISAFQDSGGLWGWP